MCLLQQAGARAEEDVGVVEHHAFDAPHPLSFSATVAVSGKSGSESDVKAHFRAQLEGLWFDVSLDLFASRNRNANVFARPIQCRAQLFDAPQTTLRLVSVDNQRSLEMSGASQFSDALKREFQLGAPLAMHIACALVAMLGASLFLLLVEQVIDFPPVPNV